MSELFLGIIINSCRELFSLLKLFKKKEKVLNYSINNNGNNFFKDLFSVFVSEKQKETADVEKYFENIAYACVSA